MHLEDSRRIDGERAVDVNRYRGNRSLVHQPVQRVNHFLGSTDCKCGNQNPATARCGVTNYLGQLSTGSFHGLMVAVAVRRFHNQRVSSLRRSWIAHDRQPAASYVTGENESLRFPILRTVERDRRRAKNVASIDIRSSQPRNDVERPVVRNANHQIHRAYRVAYAVQRLDEILSSLGKKLRVLLLYMRGVSEHYGRKITRC